MYTGPACQQKCCLYNQKHHTLPLQNIRLAKEVTHTIHERGLDILVSRKKDPYSCRNLDGYQVVCPSHFRTYIPFLENKLKRKKCPLETFGPRPTCHGVISLVVGKFVGGDNL